MQSKDRLKIVTPVQIHTCLFSRLKHEHTNDLLAGMTASAVALPQAMGLGVVLFAAMGLDAASGALAGLMGAVILSLCSGLAGATTAMISAPNGPVTMLLVASLYDISLSGVDSSALLICLAIILVLGGCIQVMLGITLGGHLVKYIPYPVIAGLVTGIGLLMIFSQIEAITNTSIIDVEGVKKSIPIMIALLTLAGIHLSVRYWPGMPSILVGMIVGMFSFHLINSFISIDVPAEWVVGKIPSIQGLINIPGFEDLYGLPWLKLFTAAMAVAMLASIDCLLTAVVADGKTQSRHDSKKELTAQGVGQIIAGFCGAIGGGGTKGSTLVAIDSQGRRWPAVVCAMFIFSLILFAGNVGLYLPLSVLAGVIAYVGFNLIELNIFNWLQKKRLRIDGLVAVAVILSTLIYDLLVGLGVGLIGSMLLYIRSQIRVPVLHDRSTGKEHRSLQQRTMAESRLLDDYGERIIYVELRGNLFFGTADRLYNELLIDLEKPVWMVINLRRVQHIDSSAVHLLAQMASKLQQSGGTMLFSNVIKHSGGFKKINKAFRQLGSIDELVSVKTFQSTDAALQYAEDSLLESIGAEPNLKQSKITLEENRLCANLNKKTIKALTKVLRTAKYSRKEILFKQGDPGESIYLVMSGEVELRLPIGRYHYKRAAKIGPGNYFGSVSFLRPGLRSTTGIVTQDCELTILDRNALKVLMKKGEHESVIYILESVAKTMARQLRWSRDELTRLEKA